VLNDCELAGFFEQLSFVQVGIENGFNALERQALMARARWQAASVGRAKGFGQPGVCRSRPYIQALDVVAFHDSVDNALSRWADCGSPSGYASGGQSP